MTNYPELSSGAATRDHDRHGDGVARWGCWMHVCTDKRFKEDIRLEKGTRITNKFLKKSNFLDFRKLAIHQDMMEC